MTYVGQLRDEGLASCSLPSFIHSILIAQLRTSPSDVLLNVILAYLV